MSYRRTPEIEWILFDFVRTYAYGLLWSTGLESIGPHHGPSNGYNGVEDRHITMNGGEWRPRDVSARLKG